MGSNTNTKTPSSSMEHTPKTVISTPTTDPEAGLDSTKVELGNGYYYYDNTNNSNKSLAGQERALKPTSKPTNTTSAASQAKLDKKKTTKKKPKKPKKKKKGKKGKKNEDEEEEEEDKNNNDPAILVAQARLAALEAARLASMGIIVKESQWVVKAALERASVAAKAAEQMLLTDHDDTMCNPEHASLVGEKDLTNKKESYPTIFNDNKSPEAQENEDSNHSKNTKEQQSPSKTTKTKKKKRKRLRLFPRRSSSALRRATIDVDLDVEHSQDEEEKKENDEGYGYYEHLWENDSLLGRDSEEKQAEEEVDKEAKEQQKQQRAVQQHQAQLWQQSTVNKTKDTNKVKASMSQQQQSQQDSPRRGSDASSHHTKATTFQKRPFFPFFTKPCPPPKTSHSTHTNSTSNQSSSLPLHMSSTDSKKATKAAPWMCSLCGYTFASASAASLHEWMCVQRACHRGDFFEKDGGVELRAWLNWSRHRTISRGFVASDGGRRKEGKENLMMDMVEALGMTLGSSPSSSSLHEVGGGPGGGGGRGLQRKLSSKNLGMSIGVTVSQTGRNGSWLAGFTASSTAFPSPGSSSSLSISMTAPAGSLAQQMQEWMSQLPYPCHGHEPLQRDKFQQPCPLPLSHHVHDHVHPHSDTLDSYEASQLEPHRLQQLQRQQWQEQMMLHHLQHIQYLLPRVVTLDDGLKRQLRLTDESIVTVTSLSIKFMCTPKEVDAERELAFLARDGSYYAHMDRRAVLRRQQRKRRGGKTQTLTSNTESSRMGVWSAFSDTIHHRLGDAYDLIKGEGDLQKQKHVDHYGLAGGQHGGSGPRKKEITHDNYTLYLNVLVKNSVQVLSSELDRMAKLRWQQQHGGGDDGGSTNLSSSQRNVAVDNPFAAFRAQAQQYVVRLASLALESDFKPRRIAVQMSNDFYRLLVPELKRRGVLIETEIEYRVGAFFVLAMNVLSIDWVRFIEHTHNDLKRRRKAEKRAAAAAAKHAAKTSASSDSDAAGPSGAEDGGGGGEGADSPASSSSSSESTKEESWFQRLSPVNNVLYWCRSFPSIFDLIAYCIALLHRVHWIVSVPFCMFWFRVVFRKTLNIFIFQSVTDDLFRYVENKGMEMDMQVRTTHDQAAFMLGVLRKMRADERKQKQDKEMEDEEGGKPLLGPLLGPNIKEDKLPAKPPADFTPPEPLEHMCLEIDIAVGFRRVRWALLRSDSEFLRNAIMTVEERFSNIQIGPWSVHDEFIGLPELPPEVDMKSFVGAVQELSYLIPANAMVKANTANETNMILEYNDHCFAYKRKTQTPEVPFGSSFYTWTQVVVYDLGNENCHIVCSSGWEFPNGRPMVARQIESGIRSMSTEAFVRLGETIMRYA